MKFRILVLMLLIGGTIQSYAQKPSNEFGYKHGIGASASFTSGYGVSYRYYFNDKFAIQPTGFLYYFRDDEEKFLGYNFGLEIQRNLFFSDDERYYAYIGTSYHHHFDSDDWINVMPNYDLYETQDQSYNVGAGIGYDYLFNNRFSIGFTGGFRYYFTESKELIRFDEYKTSTREGFLFSIGINFYVHL